MAQGTMLMTQAHALLTQALQMFPGDSPQYKDIHRSIGVLGRHMSQTAPTSGVQQTQIGDMLRNIMRHTLLQQIMQKQKGGGGGPPGGGGGGPPPEAMGGGAQPSMPLPGA